MPPEPNDAPSFVRILAKIGLRAIIQNHAPDLAYDLRASARRDYPGLGRSAKRALADTADAAADDPEPWVNLLEALWDSGRQAQRVRRPPPNW